MDNKEERIRLVGELNRIDCRLSEAINKLELNADEIDRLGIPSLYRLREDLRVIAKTLETHGQRIDDARESIIDNDDEIRNKTKYLGNESIWC